MALVRLIVSNTMFYSFFLMSTVIHNGADLCLSLVALYSLSSLQHAVVLFRLMWKEKPGMVSVEQKDMISASLVGNKLNILLLLQHACLAVSFCFFAPALSLSNFSTAGTFLWQLVTTEQFHTVCLRAWFSNDVTYSKHHPTVTTVHVNESYTCLPVFIYQRRCC